MCYRQDRYQARNDLLFRLEVSCFRSWPRFCPRSLASLQPSNSHVMQVVPRPGRRLPPPPNAPIVAANDPKSCNPPQWIKLRTKHREAELRRNARTKAVADYMKQIIPAAAIPSSPSPPPTYSLNLMQSQDAGHRLMWRRRLFPRTHTSVRRDYIRDTETRTCRIGWWWR